MTQSRGFLLVKVPHSSECSSFYQKKVLELKFEFGLRRTILVFEIALGAFNKIIASSKNFFVALFQIKFEQVF